MVVKEPDIRDSDNTAVKWLRGVRSTPRASAREDLRRNFCAAANFKYQRGYRSRNSGVRSCRSCRIREQGLYPKIQDQHLPGKILGKLPDSLAPELLQLLTPEFRNVLGSQAQVSEKLQDLQNPRALNLRAKIIRR